jgi:hypothetical protein
MKTTLILNYLTKFSCVISRHGQTFLLIIHHSLQPRTTSNSFQHSDVKAYVQENNLQILCD